MRSITVLGATGSIGLSTLDVVSRHPDRFRVYALSANRQVDRLLELCRAHRPKFAVIGSDDHAGWLEQNIRDEQLPTQVLSGPQALETIASAPEVDVLMAAIVGAAGLRSAVAAARAGKTILLANKESLVMAGQVFLSACNQGGGTVLPIDSEHNAIFQCLPAPGTHAGSSRGVRRILLTASGGPFRTASMEQIEAATPDAAVAHPRWAMGRKISVDSATMMNKGLELIEAHYLFDLPSEAIQIVVHPQSIVHSMVEYVDGSVLAQLGNPDMRTPIAHALGFPSRIESGVSPLDLAQVGKLEFEPPDPVRFPCLRLARAALTAGGGAPCVLNAANEVSVGAFLDGKIGFGDIARVNESVLDRLGASAAGHDVDGVLALDLLARDAAQSFIKARSV
jgi:1-deoxy-D-xylulose-5-phosphate reductoisomerase